MHASRRVLDQQFELVTHSGTLTHVLPTCSNALTETFSAIFKCDHLVPAVSGNNFDHLVIPHVLLPQSCPQVVC